MPRYDLIQSAALQPDALLAAPLRMPYPSLLVSGLLLPDQLLLLLHAYLLVRLSLPLLYVPRPDAWTVRMLLILLLCPELYLHL